MRVITYGYNFIAKDNQYLITGNVFHNNIATIAIFNQSTNEYIKGINLAAAHYESLSIQARINTILAII